MKDGKLKNCILLFLTFFKIGALTFGGGLAMIPFMERETAERRGWIKKEDLLDIVVVSESTPGPIAINAATFIGYTTAGLFGAVCATIGVVLPSFIIILALSYGLEYVKDIPVVMYALKGIRAGVLALIIRAVWTLFSRTDKNVFSYIVMVLAFVAVFFFSVDVIIIIVTGALLGLGAFLIARRAEKK